MNEISIVICNEMCYNEKNAQKSAPLKQGTCGDSL